MILYSRGIPENSFISFVTDKINIIKAHIDGKSIRAIYKNSLPCHSDIISRLRSALN